MMKLTAQGKFIDTAPIERLLTQGEHCSDCIHIILPTVNNEVDVRTCTFTMRTVAENGSMTETLLRMIFADDTETELLWEISNLVTAIPGLLQLELVGAKDNTVVIKYKMPAIYVKEAVMGSNVPIPDVADEKLTQMNAILKDVSDLADFIGDNSDAVQEIIDARTGSLSSYTYSSLSQRLRAELDACVTQGELESALKNVLQQSHDTGVGRVWYNADGHARGEIFGDYAHNEASGHRSTALGQEAVATGAYAIAMGYTVRASALQSLTLGTTSFASGKNSVAIGTGAAASGVESFAIGKTVSASAANAIAIGYNIKAESPGQVVLGCNNIADASGNYVLIFGNGTTENGQSNALTLTQNGALWTAGDVTAGTVSLYETRQQLLQTASAAGLAKKNLLPYPAAITKGGISFSCDSNGYMTAANTSTDSRQWTSANAQYSVALPAGTYVLSFHSAILCSNAYGNIFIMNAENTKIASIGQENYCNKESGEVEFTLDEAQTVYVMAKIFDGKTAIMIRSKDIIDGSYEPYKPDLQTQIDALITRIAALEGSGSVSSDVPSSGNDSTSTVMPDAEENDIVQIPSVNENAGADIPVQIPSVNENAGADIDSTPSENGEAEIV